MFQSLQKPHAHDAVTFLRYYFLSDLDPVHIPDPWEDAIADSLTAEGVLIQSDRFRAEYRMASAFVDGFLCTKLLSARYPIRPRDAPPVVDKKLVLDAVKEAMRHFERVSSRTILLGHIKLRILLLIGAPERKPNAKACILPSWQESSQLG